MVSRKSGDALSTDTFIGYLNKKASERLIFLRIHRRISPLAID
jgi:hypothetical protein